MADDSKSGRPGADSASNSRPTPGKNAALILVDVQEDFCEPKGALAVKSGRALAQYWNKLLASPSFKSKVATHDWHPTNHISFASQHPGALPFTSQHTIQNPENKDETFKTTLWPDHCVAESRGARLISEIRQQHLNYRIYKGQDRRVECYSAFGPPFRSPMIASSDLDDFLKDSGVKEVWVVGLAYDYCVKHTAIDAAEKGYRTFVVESATKAVDASDGNLEVVRKELREAGVTAVEDVEVVEP